MHIKLLPQVTSRASDIVAHAACGAVVIETCCPGCYAGVIDFQPYACAALHLFVAQFSNFSRPAALGPKTSGTLCRPIFPLLYHSAVAAAGVMQSLYTVMMAFNGKP